jgi:hypothetical protein
VVAALVLLLAVCTTAVISTANGRKFYDDDPIAREPESQDASKVEEWDIELLVDLSINLFAPPGGKGGNIRAGNINTIDEVPDSSWFTNRIGSREVTLDELRRGPLDRGGPAPGRWNVVAPKKSGMAPGFTMRDANDELWFVSFDSAGHPEAATGAILVANKIFWALGYWQVENHLVTIRRDQINIASSAKFTPLSGKRRPMTPHDLDEVFARAHASPDGSYRAVAARGLPGRPVGGFRYHGTRPDDPNDVVPHQHRRELRALKVFGAWTNLVDMKAGNTLDTVVTENGRGLVRHYLQDVGSTFGTGANGPREYDEGFEYLVELDLVRQRFFRLGFPIKPWQTAKYEDNHAIGRFEAETFDAATWKPRVPTAAFLQARADDGFWAARRVAAFTDEMIRTMVETGQYSDPDDVRLLTDVLIARRQKILRHYLTAINPLVTFTLSADGQLTFRNAAVDAGVGAPPPDGYRAAWSTYDNLTGNVASLGSATFGAATAVAAPGPLPGAAGTFLRIALAAVGSEHAAWALPVEIYFKRVGSTWLLVGIDRLP